MIHRTLRSTRAGTTWEAGDTHEGGGVRVHVEVRVGVGGHLDRGTWHSVSAKD